MVNSATTQQRTASDLLNPFVVILVAIPSMALAAGLVLFGLVTTITGGVPDWLVAAYPYAVGAVGAVFLFRWSLDPSDHVVGRLVVAAVGGAMGAGVVVGAAHVAVSLFLVVICSGGGCGG